MSGLQYAQTLILVVLQVIFATAQGSFDGVAIHLHTGQVVIHGEPDRPLVPASILKVPTLSYAMSQLGSDHSYVTPVYYTGDKDGHVLKGDIVIEGSGDPSLASRHFDKDAVDVFDNIYDMLKNEGIDCVKGRLLLDLGEWGNDVVSPFWLWEDLGNYYASGGWGLNWLDNSIRISFTKGAQQPVLKKTYPSSSHVEWINQLKYGADGSGDQAYVFAGPIQTKRWIRGTLPQNMMEMSIKGSMDDPPYMFLFELKKYLINRGIQIDGAQVTYSEISDNNKVELGKIESPPLKKLINIALLESDNLYVESICRSVFDQKNYKEYLTAFRRELNRHFDVSIQLRDACGLSPTNRMTPEEGARIAHYLHQHHQEFVALLPHIQQSSLRSALSNDVAGRVKSGSMADVLTYIGIWKGEWAFAMLYNGTQSRGKVKKDMGHWLSELSLNRK